MLDYISSRLAQLWAETGIWQIVAYIGQAMFCARFVLQWIVSERRGESVIPIGFWYLSIIGSLIVLAYALYLASTVSIGKSFPFVVAYGFNSFVYVRNLMLIHRKKKRTASTDSLDAA